MRARWRLHPVTRLRACDGNLKPITRPRTHPRSDTTFLVGIPNRDSPSGHVSDNQPDLFEWRQGRYAASGWRKAGFEEPVPLSGWQISGFEELLPLFRSEHHIEFFAAQTRLFSIDQDRRVFMIKCRPGTITVIKVYFLLCMVFFPWNAVAGEIQVDLLQARSSMLKQGLVHGLGGYTGRTTASDVADTWISATKPGSWRFSGIRSYGYGDMYKFVVEDYHYDTRFGTITVFNLQDAFNARYGNPVTIKASCLDGESGCFTSFSNLRQTWNAFIRNLLVKTKAAAIVFFDLLAEPEFSFQNVSQVQLYRLSKDAYYLVREIRPEARIVGPSIASFRPVVLETLISNMVRDGIHLDAFSWHEFGDDPGAIGQHVATMKSFFQKYPAICQPSCPEIHINEYQGEETMLIPGHAVGWLRSLESSNVSQANRACWGGDAGSPIPYQSCWYGFAGFLTPDSSSPQPLYWVYKFYADLNASRFATTSTLSKIAAISGQLGNGGIGILAGNYGTTQSDVQLQLVNFNWASARIKIFRIGNTFNQVMSLPTVDAVKTFNATPTNSVLTFQLDSFAAGDAFWIVITPSSLLSPWGSVR